MKTINIQLLGGFTIKTHDQIDIDLRGKKHQGLIAYLCLSENFSASRQKLISMFWSTRSEEQAKASLRQVLSELRKTFREHRLDIIESDRSTVSLDPNCFEVDTSRLKEIARINVLRVKLEVLDLYTGELLEGLEINDRSFKDWIHAEKIQFRELCREVLNDLINSYYDVKDYEKTISIANKLLFLDNLDESAHRFLMLAYSDQGNKALALKQYKAYCEKLSNELQGYPSQETAALYEKINSENFTPAVTASNTGEYTEPKTHDLSIAVLPFRAPVEPKLADLSAEITEDITAALSRFKWMSVVPRRMLSELVSEPNLSVKIGDSLGVRYVLDGSVRLVNREISLSIELIDVRTKKLIWGERFNSALADLPKLGVEVVPKIVSQVDVRLRVNEVKRVLEKKAEESDAYERVLRAISNMHEMTQEAYAGAREQFKQAIKIDPDFAATYSWWAFWEIFYIGQRWASDLEKEKADASSLVSVAIRKDPEDALALAISGHFESFVYHQFDQAVSLFDRSLALNPNSAFAWMLSSATYSYIGDPAEALRRLDHSQNLCPIEPHYEFLYNTARAIAYNFSVQYDEAVTWGRRTVRESPNFSNGYKQLLVSLGHLGYEDEAKEYRKRLLELEPGFCIDEFRRTYPFKFDEHRLMFVRGLRKAGVPEDKNSRGERVVRLVSSEQSVELES